MSERLTKQDRQRIVDDFCEKHGGWDARTFYQEVRATNGQHPAWAWFTWDDGRAADEYRIWEARTFVRGLVVRHSIEEIKRGKVTVREIETPRVISPLASRQKGGGYTVEPNPDDPDSMAHLCAEAAACFRSALARYGGAIAWAGGSTASLEKIIRVLEAKAPADAA